MAKVTLGKWTDKNESFSRKIKARRIEEGVGIDILAKKAGIKRPTYFSHLRNPEQITLGELRAYCNTLKIPAESLISAVYEGDCVRTAHERLYERVKMAKHKSQAYAPLELAKQYSPIYAYSQTVHGICDFGMNNAGLNETEACGVAVKAYTTGRWTENKQVYAIGAELGEDILAMDDCSVPVETMKLPFPCFYLDVEALHLTIDGADVPGYFVLLDNVEYNEPGTPVLLCTVMILERSASGEVESYGFVMDVDRAQSENITLEQLLRQCSGDIKRTSAKKDAVAHVKNALLLAAYLSSAKPDISENSEQAQIYRPTRDPLRYASIRKWDVGIRYMRAARAGNPDASGVGAGTCGARKSPRAHIRKAHWHTYRVGKGRKERVVLWIPPVAVGMNGTADGKSLTLTSDDLPTVVRCAE